MSRDTLPIILVSARDETAATTIISDLINGEIPNAGNNTQNKDENVWRLVNKYYTVDVRLVPVTDSHDDAQLLDINEDRVEAHIIYLTEDECGESAAGLAEARARAGGGAEVRLALTAAGAPALAGWAARAGYELVPLPGEGGEEACGMERAREALHAHAWRGLRRVDRPGEEEEEEGQDEDEAMERFAAALGALGDASRATRALQGTARLDAAEELVAAFCRALAVPIDDC